MKEKEKQAENTKIELVKYSCKFSYKNYDIEYYSDTQELTLWNNKSGQLVFNTKYKKIEMKDIVDHMKKIVPSGVYALENLQQTLDKLEDQKKEVFNKTIKK